LDWYPYNSLSSVPHLTTLLGGGHEAVLEAGKRKGILDLGCGDGDPAFFWESQGYAVTGIDYLGWTVSNFNRLLYASREYTLSREKFRRGIIVASLEFC
jgi:SAM-dependent methyltransferase